MANAKVVEVIGILGPYSRIGAEGQLERYFTVKARTAAGVNLEVDVPFEQMDPTKVQPMLETKARQIDAVRNIKA